MIARIRRNLSFANVVSMLALLVALGGTSYAAVALPDDSVDSPQIKSSAVKNSELGADAVTTGKIKDATLLAADFAVGELPPKGPKGDTGATGPAGAPGGIAAATVQHLPAPADLADGAKGSYAVYCPAGQQAIGGGVRGDDLSSEQTVVTSSRPAISTVNGEPPASGGGFDGWKVTVFNPPGGDIAGIRPDMWVVCVPAP